MRRTTKRRRPACWPSWLLIAGILTSLLAEPALAAAHFDRLLRMSPESPTAYARVKRAHREARTPARDLSAQVNRKIQASSSGAQTALDAGAGRDLRSRMPACPGFASRLDSCAEFTKPDSLKTWRMGAPQNHCSPPA
jgi:hypothetical protein